MVLFENSTADKNINENNGSRHEKHWDAKLFFNMKTLSLSVLAAAAESMSFKTVSLLIMWTEYKNNKVINAGKVSMNSTMYKIFGGMCFLSLEE